MENVNGILYRIKV